ncbi:hypothetical protein R4K95_30905, partial [Pseudomonas aeruginosa]
CWQLGGYLRATFHCRQNANKFRSEPTALDTSCDRTLPAGILVCLGQECGALLQPLQVVIVKLLPELWRSGQLLQSCIGFPPALDQLINTEK